MTKTEEIIKKIRESGIKANQLAKVSGVNTRSTYDFMAGSGCHADTLAKLEAAYYAIKEKSQSVD
jgi:predicted transcriptional regulator